MTLRLSLAVAVVCSVAFAVLLAEASADELDLRAHGRYAERLRALRTADAEVDRLVLQARLGLLAHYDALVQSERDVVAALTALGLAAGSHNGQPAVPAPEAQGSVAQLLSHKLALLERFKTQHAAFRNSARYFPTAVGAFMELGPPTPALAAAGALLGAVAKFLQSSEAYLGGQLRARIDALSALGEGLDTARQRRAENHARMHATLLFERKPALDALVQELLGLPTARHIDALDARHARTYEAALARADARKLWLFALAIAALSAGAAYVLLRLRRSSAQLSDAFVQLGRANQRLRVEQAKERELHELKTRFAARTSHEFRTPLSIIMSSSELLANYGPRFAEEKREEHRARIESSVREMTQMLDEVLSTFRDEGGEAVLKPEPVEVVALCRSVAAQVAEATNSGARLAVAAAEERIDMRLDPRLARRILTNLLTNALKYSASDQPVELTLRTSDGQLELSVMDRGLGIPDADQVHLFEDFHRGSNVQAIPGTGLGLSVARRAAEAHGGSISVTSRVGVGSTFVVRLPCPKQRAHGEMPQRSTHD